MLTEGHMFADRYDVREHLGSGGMGEVYRVHDRVLDEEIALKTLTSSLITAEGIDLFKEEVKLARRVTHKNVARVFDIGRSSSDATGDNTGGTLFMTMELIRGETLRKRIRRAPPLTLLDTLAIVESIAAGLGAAHEAGIAHRDVKPGNVMLALDAAGGAGNVRIIDFGGAHLLAGEDTSPNVGTVKYMAPEQLLNDVVGAAADVYAIGLVLFEMVVGRAPFGDSSDEEKARSRITQTAPDLRAFVHAPDELAVLVARCLTIDPDGRPSAVDVERALHALRMQAPVMRDAFAFEPTQLQQLERTASFSMEARAIDAKETHWIAVLPFASTRDDDEGRLLAAEVASSLREILATTAGLQVAPLLGPVRGRAQEQTTSIRDIGRALDVDVIVDGTLSFGDAGRATVSARAIDTETAKTLISVEVDGKIGDIVVLQHSIAERIAEALRVQLAAHAWRGVVSDGAMQMWLRARSRARLGSVTDLAVDYEELDRCLSIAPELRPAWAARALVAMRLAIIPVDVHRDWDAPARNAVADALREAPDIADTQLAAAFLAEQDGLYDDTVARAEEALRLAPSFAEAHELLGRLDVESGRFQRGIDRLRWAARLDRRCISSLALLERGAHFRNRPDIAARIARSLDGRVPLEHLLLKLRLFVWSPSTITEMSARDLDELRRQVDAVPLEPGRTLFPAMLTVATGGAPTDLFALLANVQQRAPRTRYLLLLHQLCAEVLARSDRSATLDHIETAANAGLFDLDWLDRCPPLREVADDVRFTTARAVVARRVGATHALLLREPRDIDDDDATKRMRPPPLK